MLNKTARKQTLAGRTFFNHVQNINYNILASDSPTPFLFSPSYNPDILDILLVRIPLLIKLINLNRLSSDYNPILFELYNSPITNHPPISNHCINLRILPLTRH